jgi:hypothetical protein
MEHYPERLEDALPLPRRPRAAPHAEPGPRRQLNRRMRKPCYPTSPGLDATALCDRVTAEVALAARQDRQVRTSSSNPSLKHCHALISTGVRANGRVGLSLLRTRQQPY